MSPARSRRLGNPNDSNGFGQDSPPRTSGYTSVVFYMAGSPGEFGDSRLHSWLVVGYTNHTQAPFA